MHDRKIAKAVDLSFLQCVCGVRAIDRISNVEIKRFGKKVGFNERMDRGVLR